MESYRAEDTRAEVRVYDFCLSLHAHFIKGPVLGYLNILNVMGY